MNKKVLYGILFGIFFFHLAFFILSTTYAHSKQNIPVPPLLGNSPENIASIHEENINPHPFTMFLIADTHSKVMFEHFFTKTNFDSSPDFGIMLGDFVDDPEDQRHEFFIMEMSEWGLEYPLFLAPGNHDIAVKEKYLKKKNAFTMDEFEDTYGATNFSFICSGCLFIVINNHLNTEYIDFLNDVLSSKPESILLTFIFMHIPPQTLSPLMECRGMENVEGFMNLMETYAVDYVFSGDYHSYFRSTIGSTEYIVLGGGGAALDGNEGRRFHHAMLLNINPEKETVHEMIYPINSVIDILDLFEQFAFFHIYNLFVYDPALYVLILTTNLALLFALIVCMARLKKRGAL